MCSEFKPTVPGTPIGGIIVKGGKNPGGQMFVQTTTDALGNYTLFRNGLFEVLSDWVGKGEWSLDDAKHVCDSIAFKNARTAYSLK